jgi:GntR family transcriptional regulator, transcriptional repressor for pyruvate dehydrogenase complex
MAKDFDVSTMPRGARAEEVRKRLEARILAGDFGPGDQLPSERELVEIFGVSRLSVREGIQGLIGIGLVEARHGLGYFVASDISGTYRNAFATWVTLHGDDLIDMYQVRGALTKLAAERALLSLDGDAVQPILDAHHALVEAVERDAGPQDIADLDIAFHNSIGEASGSPLIASLLRELHERLNEPRHAIMSLPGQRTRSAEEHQSIVDALQAGDVDRVARAVDAHIASVCATIREQVAGRSDGAERNRGA